MMVTVTLFLVCFMPLLAFGQWKGTVSDVLSGDQYKIKKASGVAVDIRLYGIACPKSGQPYGDEATIQTANKLISRKVRVKPVDTGMYGRIIAKVYYRSILVNQWLLQKGLAWVYDKYCQKPICKQWKRIQERKKAGSTGLWSQSNPRPPWQYR